MKNTVNHHLSMKLFSVGKDSKHYIFNILGLKVSFRSKIITLNTKVKTLENELADIKRELLVVQQEQKAQDTSLLNNEAVQNTQATQNAQVSQNIQQIKRELQTSRAENRELSNHLRALSEFLFPLWEKLFGWDSDIRTAYFKQNWTPLLANRLRMMGRILSIYNNSAEGKGKNRVICYLNKDTAVTGLGDRLRTIATAYVMAAESGLKFHVYHDAGFSLLDYLAPNEVDWSIRKEDVCLNLNQVCPLFFISRFRMLEKCNKDYHIYQSDSYLDKFLTDDLREKYSNHSVFHRLFKFRPEVTGLVAEYFRKMNIKEKLYVAVHCRFLNFFEQVEVNGSVNSTPEQRKAMTDAVHRTIAKIHSETQLPVILFSDSNSFLAAEHESYVYVLPGKVGHVVKRGDDAEEVMKTFVDFYVMSQAHAVYSLTGDNLYNSHFSRDAAVIGNVPFIREPLVCK